MTAALGTVADADGTVGAAFAFRWQVLSGAVWIDIAGATTASFTPTQTQVGLPIRAVVSFIDSNGNAEQVASAATTVVGDLFTGNGAANVFPDYPLYSSGDDDAVGMRCGPCAGIG